MTKILVVDSAGDNIESYARVVDKWLAGDVVAFPTETVYGLGADARNAEAVAKIFEAKSRPADNPLIVHIAETKQLQGIAASVPKKAKRAMDAFWPGPFTAILPVVSGAVAENVTAGLSTVGVRMPSHPVARELLKQAGIPIAAPSANRSGKPSPTSASHVAEDLDGRIPLIVDGGPATAGLESTVVDFSVEPPALLRPGSVTEEMLIAVVGEVQGAGRLREEQAPKAPGMKYTHYAPDAPVRLAFLEEDGVAEKLARLREAGRRVALVAVEEHRGLPHDAFLSLGKAGDWAGISRELFAALRACNQLDVDVIVAGAYPREGLGQALMNRLEKAAGGEYL
ncbi:L-threonylcarbamoyladenylate synthase [Chryseomicrobium palamuruense]|uniref:Threonylcarbamoyl-AMP synthase n=1 Tax=Chryseomicrobium palamuruense TaxID=682973 RepID=A0ABV8UUF2_9BACL